MQMHMAAWLQNQTKSWGHQLQGLARALQVACPGCPASSPALRAACHTDDPTLPFKRHMSGRFYGLEAKNMSGKSLGTSVTQKPT